MKNPLLTCDYACPHCKSLNIVALTDDITGQYKCNDCRRTSRGFELLPVPVKA